MRMGQKLICGFVGVALLVGLVGYISVNTCQKTLQKTIGENSVTLTVETLDKIDRDIHNKIEEFCSYCKDLTLQEAIIKSNQRFQKLDNIQDYIGEKDIELESFMPDSELVVHVDSDKIVRVLTNLVSNAIKTVAPNGHIGVRVKDAGSEIAVEVQDDGPSIESSEIDRFFNRLDQIRRQLRYDKEEDLALGLLIAKELLETHGGCIWAESGDGRGNNFCFTLPKSGVREEVSTAAKAGERGCEDCTQQ